MVLNLKINNCFSNEFSSFQQLKVDEFDLVSLIDRLVGTGQNVTWFK